MVPGTQESLYSMFKNICKSQLKDVPILQHPIYFPLMFVFYVCYVSLEQFT